MINVLIFVFVIASFLVLRPRSIELHILFLGIVGFIVITLWLFSHDSQIIESLQDMQTSTQYNSCPARFIHEDGQLRLYYDDDKSQNPNPRIFNSIEEYKTFYVAQRNRGMECMALTLSDPSNSYKETSLSTHQINLEKWTAKWLGDSKRNYLTGTLPKDPVQPQYAPSSPFQDEDSPPNTMAGVTGIDTSSQNQGVYTTVDARRDQTQAGRTDTYVPAGVSLSAGRGELAGVSWSSMDPNWGGAEYSRQVANN